MNKYRKYMILAYEEMLKSNNYHNSDKYQAPLLGCLLLFSNGKYITAHRDESAEYKHAAYQEFDEENNKYITGSLNKNEIMLPLDDKHANDYNTARYALQLYTNQSSIKNIFTEYNEFKDYYEYSYEYYENYIILKSVNPFGFYLGENESFKMMALASIENNYSIETSLYFNVNTLQVDKLAYSYKGITISPMLGSYSEVKFELVNSSKNNEDINVLVDELKTTVKNSCITN